MATYGYGAAAAAAQQYHSHTPTQHSSSSSTSQHHARSRRGPRIASQNTHRHYKAQRSPKDTHHHLLSSSEASSATSPTSPRGYSEYLQRLEAARSFEFDDDEVFCPFHLLTEDDLQSIHSASSSDRGSLSSESPEGSPLQAQVQPTPSFLLSSSGAGSVNGYHHPSANYHHQQQQQQQLHQQHQHVKLHQPMAQRTRNAIPIVDPSTRSVASPPLSISPARMQQQYQVPRRW